LTKKTPDEILFERAQRAKGNGYKYSYVPAKVFDRAVASLPIKNYTSSNGRTYASFYYCAPVNELPNKNESETIIKGKGIRCDVKICENGRRFDALFQEITDDEFSAYCKDPHNFTAKKIF
jgi:hypothetical protein